LDTTPSACSPSRCAVRSCCSVDGRAYPTSSSFILMRDPTGERESRRPSGPQVGRLLEQPARSRDAAEAESLIVRTTMVQTRRSSRSARERSCIEPMRWLILTWSDAHYRASQGASSRSKVGGVGTPTLIVVSGPAGSGKTTLAHELAVAVGCPALCAATRSRKAWSRPTRAPSQQRPTR
jgi:hypothetical protein